MHYYEKNIVDIKNEYTTFLKKIITPSLYEGIKAVYVYSQDCHQKFLEKQKQDNVGEVPSVLKIFQTCLKEIPTLNSNSIEQETAKIKNNSKCAEWFDDLIRAVIKSNILLLTFTASKEQSELVNEKFHEKIDCKDFIHKCYIIASRHFYNNPVLFWHGYSPIEIKQNQRVIMDNIDDAIEMAIKESLPMKHILEEFLKGKGEYLALAPDEQSGGFLRRSPGPDEYIRLKTMVDRDLGNNNNNIDDNLLDDGNNLLDRDDDRDHNIDDGFEELVGGADDPDQREELINDIEKLKEQLDGTNHVRSENAPVKLDLTGLKRIASKDSSIGGFRALSRSSSNNSNQSHHSRQSRHTNHGADNKSSKDITKVPDLNRADEGESKDSKKDVYFRMYE